MTLVLSADIVLVIRGNGQTLTKELKQPPSVVYDTMLFLHETAAQHLEKIEESFTVGIGFLMWDELTHEEQDQVNTWLENIRAAREAIRGLEE